MDENGYVPLDTLTRFLFSEDRNAFPAIRRITYLRDLKPAQDILLIRPEFSEERKRYIAAIFLPSIGNFLWGRQNLEFKSAHPLELTFLQRRDKEPHIKKVRYFGQGNSYWIDQVTIDERRVYLMRN